MCVLLISKYDLEVKQHNLDACKMYILSDVKITLCHHIGQRFYWSLCFIRIVRDLRQILLLILSEFKRTHKLLFPWNHQKTIVSLMISGGIKVNYLSDLLIIRKIWWRPLFSRSNFFAVLWETYLGPSQTSMIELFFENSQRLLTFRTPDTHNYVCVSGGKKC